MDVGHNSANVKVSDCYFVWQIGNYAVLLASVIHH